jgi:transposase
MIVVDHRSRPPRNPNSNPVFLVVCRPTARDRRYIVSIEDSPQHLELRQRKSGSLVKKIWRWVDARSGKHSPKSKMGTALSYATKQRDKLAQFLYKPKLPLDNNAAERALRIVALGRKNSLFAGSAEHAQYLAIIQSIIATCRMHAVNPYDYIRHVLIKIQSHPAARIAELMPWRWRPSGA